MKARVVRTLIYEGTETHIKRTLAAGAVPENGTADFGTLAITSSTAPQQAGDGLTDERLETILAGLADQGFDTLSRADKEDLRAFAELFFAAPRQPGEMVTGVRCAVGSKCESCTCRDVDEPNVGTSEQQDEREAPDSIDGRDYD